MNEAGESPVIEPRKLKGVKVESNTEADNIENVLGIKFKRKPLKVPLTVRNRFALYVNHRDVISSPREIVKAKTSSYEPSYDALFYETAKKRADLAMLVDHENIHGFTHGANPEIDAVMQRYGDELDRMIASHGERDIDSQLLEKGAVYKTFDEGFSEYGAVEMFAIEQGYESPKRSRNFHARLTTNDVKNFSTGVPEVKSLKLLEEDVAVLRDRVDPQKYKTLWESIERGEMSIQQLRGKMEMDTETYYRAGEIFMNEAVFALRSSGLPRADSLVLLVQNPPQTFDQLSKPAQFARQVSAANKK